MFDAFPLIGHGTEHRFKTERSQDPRRGQGDGQSAGGVNSYGRMCLRSNSAETIGGCFAF
jgi:hypothetical protein